MAVRDAKSGQFIPGNPGGPGRGHKAINSRSFLQDMERMWMEHGEKAIKAMIKEDPGGFVKVAASLVPRELLVRSIGRERVVDPAIARAQVEAMLGDRVVPALGTPETPPEMPTP